MREVKRILFNPKLWLLLALLLGLNVILSIAQDKHSDGFYIAYSDALQEYITIDPAEATAMIDDELKQLQAVGRLKLWQSESNPEIKSFLRGECVLDFGENFEERIKDGEIDLSEAAMQNNYLRREVLQTIQKQLSHLTEYPAFLKQVQKNVKQMKALSIFSKPGSFSQRNIEKTGRDFPTEVALQLDNDFAVTALVTDEISGWALLIYTLFLVLQFLQERRIGLWNLVYGSGNGRTLLAVRRVGILLLGIMLGTLVLFGGKLLFGAMQYDGVGSLTRNVQSIQAFSDFPWVMPVWVCLLAYYFLKVLGMWLLGLAVWAILQAVRHLPFALAAVGAVLAVEYSFFRFIPDSYSFVILRYANLFALVNVPSVALHYLNLDLFGQPVQGFLFSLVLIPPLIALLLVVNVLLSVKKKPVARQNSLLKVFDYARIPFSWVIGRLRLLGQELYKLLWLQKGLLVLLAVGVFSFSVLDAPIPDNALYDQELVWVSASMQGPVTESTLHQIDEKIDEYSKWEPSEAVLRQLDILQRLRVKCADSLEKKDGLWLIDQMPLAALTGKNVNNYQRQIAVILTLALILLFSGVFSQEGQSRMVQLLRCSPRGGINLWRKKTIIAFVLTVMVWLIFEAGELLAIKNAYGAFVLSAPLQSFDGFSEMPYHISLGVGVAAYLILRLVAMCTVTSVVLLLSCICKQINTSILLGCAFLLLPAALSFMDVKPFQHYFFVLLFSPLEASPAKYFAAMSLIIILNCAVLFIWTKKRNNTK